MKETMNEINEHILDEAEVLSIRKEKLLHLREQGQAFPNDFRHNAFTADIIQEYENKSKEELETLHACQSY